MSGKAAVFMDRDGVIVEEVHCLSHPSQLVLLPGSANAIAELRRNGILVVVVTNQAGVARGYYPETRVLEIHRRLDELLAALAAAVDRYYYCPHHYCPHHATEGLGAYRVACECRKPRPGMLLQAARELGVDLSRSYMVGDRLSDLEAGANAGCRTIMVRTGYGSDEVKRLGTSGVRPEYVAKNLSEAVELCLPRLLAPVVA